MAGPSLGESVKWVGVWALAAFSKPVTLSSLGGGVLAQGYCHGARPPTGMQYNTQLGGTRAGAEHRRAGVNGCGATYKTAIWVF